MSPAVCALVVAFSVPPGVVSAADPIDFKIDILGGTLALQGTVLPLTFYNQLISGTPLQNDTDSLRFTDQDSGNPLPDGGIDFNCPQSPGQAEFNNVQCSGTYPNYEIGGFSSQVGATFNTDAAPAWINLVISPTARLGAHNILVTGTSLEGVVRTATWTINVVSAAQLVLAKQPFVSAPPVPERARWESDMISWGAKWCPSLNPQNFTTYLDQSIMFYDGSRVFYQISDYAKDASWITCAGAVAAAYYPQIATGNFQGYHVFSRGLLDDTQKTGRANSAAGVAVLGNVSAGYYGVPLHMTDATGLREESFALEAMLDNQTLHGVSYGLIQQSESALLGDLDQIFIQKRFTYYQPFMVGLALEALIQYNQKYPDPRVPYVVKQTLDGLWNTAWRSDLHGFYYRCYSTSLPGLPSSLPADNNGCFDAGASPGQADPNAWPIPAADVFYTYNDVQPNLNNLISPAYAWLYLQTGDTTYREKADVLFADGVLYNDAINWSGKEFSQNYRWTFDFINWRDQANNQATDPGPDTQPPVVSIVSPASGTAAGNTLSLTADASDNVYVTGVQFQVDGVNFGPPVTSPPFEQLNIPTFQLSNGPHSVTAIAYDAAGNSTTSDAITVGVNNQLNAALAQCPAGNVPTGSFQGCYYNYNGSAVFQDIYESNAENPPPPSNFGTLAAVTNDPAISFDWGGNAPRTGVSNHQFAVVWQGNQTFTPGSYTFTTAVDGNTGIRVYIDQQVVDNQWYPRCGGAGNDCPATPSAFTINFIQGGLHLIRVETWHDYSISGFDSVHVSWTRTGEITPPVVKAALSASAASVAPGQPVVLTWSSTNAANVSFAVPNAINNSVGCAGTNFSTDSRSSVTGSVTVTPLRTTSYAVTCYGPAGSATASTTVRVQEHFTARRK